MTKAYRSRSGASSPWSNFSSAALISPSVAGGRTPWRVYANREPPYMVDTVISISRPFHDQIGTDSSVSILVQAAASPMASLLRLPSRYGCPEFGTLDRAQINSLKDEYDCPESSNTSNFKGRLVLAFPGPTESPSKNTNKCFIIVCIPSKLRFPCSNERPNPLSSYTIPLPPAPQNTPKEHS